MKHTPPATLNEMLQSRVKQHPEKLALIFKDEQWSYAGFHREVDRIANGFIRIGVKRGDRIAFVLPNCAEFLFAVFAVTKIGAVFVPLNPQYTAEEAEYVLQHSEASIILTSPELLPLIDAVRDKLADLSRVIVTGEGGTATSLSWKDFLPRAADPDLKIA
ncbi:MAG TPA: AMP-binding protein, partial [Candidatus Binatia bacterium]|nr:AMP-binding protein [Candidatus Binatia bacterium]